MKRFDNIFSSLVNVVGMKSIFGEVLFVVGNFKYSTIDNYSVKVINIKTCELFERKICRRRNLFEYKKTKKC